MAATENGTGDRRLYKGKNISYRFRHASSEEDMEQLLGMIKELAVYVSPLGEKEVTNSVEGLVRDGLGQDRLFHCMLIELDGEANTYIGYALYYFTYSTWEGRQLYMEDLYVRPDWQRRGVGSGVLQRLAQIAKERDCARLMWQGLNGAENAKFYERLGALHTAEWLNYKLDRAGIQRVAELA